jgi:hypothetical protein
MAMDRIVFYSRQRIVSAVDDSARVWVELLQKDIAIAIAIFVIES